ncbi:MAG TPA: MMPL family transporter [Gaiellaceae bacterium]|nr:MMPL family transporter [Gaiellaceae bacterium]
MLARLAHAVARNRWKVIAAWIVLTLFGAFAAGQVSKRWYQSFSIPGKSAYEANQRTLKTFGTGVRPPDVVVFHTAGDATKSPAIEAATKRAAAVLPGARTSSYFSTHDLMYVSKDRHTTFAEVYPAGPSKFDSTSKAAEVRAAAARGLPSGIQVEVTGHDPLEEASSHGGGGSSVLLEAMIGGLGAIVILLFVFGTLPAILVPVAVAAAAILNTFTLVWALTYITNVSIIVEFLIALVGLGVAIDYALLMIFRFRDELREGEDVETALVETMTHAGRSVIVSGSTVAVGLLSMIILPLPFIRSIGIGGMLIPAVSVIAAITLMPAILAVLGERINSVRLLPKRFVDHGHPEDGGWGRWARFVLRRPWAVATVGTAIVAVLVVLGVQLNPNESQLKNFPGTGTAIAGRTMLADAGISPGVMKPFVTLVENGGDARTVAAKERTVSGVVGATVPPGPGWHRGRDTLVEAFPAIDGAAPGIQGVINRVNDVLPGNATLGGVPAVDRDFVHAVYGNFPYVLAFVLVLTLVLLTRAFRSIVLPIKAAILNLVSLGAAFGIVVFIFQQGHGSSLWNITATQAITAWIPLMIFAFLFGLSMDYEVFMLTRMREAYDETGSTEGAIELGLARTGKLVTSAALILMFAFLVLSSSPGFEIKEFAIGLAAGIIFDATVIRALLVPALMRLLGNANWWLPHWTQRALFIRQEPTPGPILEN